MLADPLSWSGDLLTAAPLLEHSVSGSSTMALLEISKRADSHYQMAMKSSEKESDVWDTLYKEVAETFQNRLNDVTQIFS